MMTLMLSNKSLAMRSAVPGILALSLLYLGAFPARADNVLPFSIIIATDRAIITSKDELRLNIIFKNHSDKELTFADAGFAHGAGECFNLIEVWDATGKPAMETSYGVLLGEHNHAIKDTGAIEQRNAYNRAHSINDPILCESQRSYTLHSGESLTQQTSSLTQIYDMTRPGRYFVQVERHNLPEYGGGIAASNVLVITVKP